MRSLLPWRRLRDRAPAPVAPPEPYLSEEVRRALHPEAYGSFDYDRQLGGPKR